MVRLLALSTPAQLLTLSRLQPKSSLQTTLARPLVSKRVRFLLHLYVQGIALTHSCLLPGISSDMYHQTGAYDANSAREAQGRLASFNGATAISSSQYFGRDEDEGPADTDESVLSADGISNAVRQVMEQTGIEDLESLQGAIRNGALKLSDMLQRYA